jgi:type IV pilus assembly protein PilW
MMQMRKPLPRTVMPQRGVTLVELMVGMLIGLLAVIVISQVMLISEGQKRTTTGGSDAQVNGALALFAMQRDLEMAGYGITSSPGAVGCPISARFNNVAPTGFPTTLAPVLITKEADRPVGSVGDSIRVLSSSNTAYAVPTRVVPPAYAVGGQAFPVTAALGILQGDLGLVAIDATQPCWVFQATAAPSSQSVPRADDAANWNPPGMPNLAYADGSVLINLGTLVDNTYQIVSNTLRQETFDVGAPNSRPTRDVQTDIVNMRALYGKDTSAPADGVVDVYDDVTPTTNAGWLQVIAVRVVVVARSEQFEKEPVTPANLLWDVGTTPPTTGAAACGTSECLTLKVDHLTDWTRYRYKQFETVIPLRNMLWKS